MKKSIIITGAAGNLGKTITVNLLKEGYFIYGTLGPHDDPNYLEDKFLKSEIVNLSDENDSLLFTNKIINENNIICLICLVGGYSLGGIETSNLGDIQKMININFATTYNIVRPLVTHYKREKKPLQIILIGSRPALIPEEGKECMAYALSKSLLFKLSEFINVEVNATQIQSSIIVPSTLNTANTRAAMPDKNSKFWVPTKNVAETVSFILSNSGKMMRNPVYQLYNHS